MEFRNDGIMLWFGTDDAPAPGDTVVPGGRIKMTFGVCPRHPDNTVIVQYSVDDRPEQCLRAYEAPRRWALDKQYFEALFPALPHGAVVRFLPVCSHGSARVPSSDTRQLLASFEVRDESFASPPVAPATLVETSPRHPFSQEYIATFSVFVHDPEQLGQSPSGLNVNWWVKEGSFSGPRIRGNVRAEGADWMTIRPDGIGVMDVRATLETHDGALISSAYRGVFELGPDGYQKFLRGQYPKRPEARAAPRYLTADARYSWLNRVQCFSVGSIDMATLHYVYDVYALG